jgi:hypothetical protein
VLALAAFASLEGLGRRHRRPDDPRFALLIAGLAVAWVSMDRFVLPGTSWTISAPFEVLRTAVPGLDAIRSGMAIGDGFQLIAALLAGLGAAGLLSSCPPGARAITSLGLLVITGAELFVPWRASAIHGPPLLGTWPARPLPRLVAVATRLPPGAVLDVPVVRGKANPRLRGHYLILSAFHLQPTAACHNSFSSPLTNEIQALAQRLPDERAADALYALGFRTLIAHHEELPRGARISEVLRRGGVRFQGRAHEIARAPGHTVYRLETPLEIRAEFSALAPAPDSTVEDLVLPRGTLTFTIENTTTAVYRHPDPIQPTPCSIRWYDSSGRLVATQQQTLLLPLALGAGDRAMRSVSVRVPVPVGTYEVTLAREAAPDTPIGRRRVEVRRRQLMTN